jgi:hypothetical protein
MDLRLVPSKEGSHERSLPSQGQAPRKAESRKIRLDHLKMKIGIKFQPYDVIDRPKSKQPLSFPPNISLGNSDFEEAF